MSQYNVVHLTRPGTDYEGAARNFERWLDDRILEPDPRSMYVHEVAFDGHVRRDLVAALRLQPYADKVVLPHERTHPGPKEDRLALLRATKVSLEPLWFLYEGQGSGIAEVLERVAARAPAVSFAGPEDTTHRLWVISDPAIHASIHASLERLPVLIADGHHRYETALAYADQAVRWVDEGVGTAAFFLEAPDVREVLKLAREGKTLPQKATYFHPKPPSGMVFDRLERDRRL